MNNLFKVFAFVLGLALTVSLTAFNFTEQETAQEEVVGVSFTIKNDTGSTVRLYDGKGHFSINNSSSKKVNVEAGRKYYTSERGTKGDFLFEVESDFAGEKIKLSDYM